MARVTYGITQFLPERDYATFWSVFAIENPSVVCLSSVRSCDLLRGWNFRQYFVAILYHFVP